MRTGILATACGVMLGAASIASADINYGDFSGTDYDFLNVSESSGTDVIPLFGAPGVFGNTLDFDPIMTATAAGLNGVDITDAQINLMVASTNGSGVSVLSFWESGDTTLVGGDGSAAASVVAATFFIEVLEVDGVGIDPVADVFMMQFAPSDGTFNLAEDGELAAAAWTGELVVDIDALLAANNIDGEATLVNIVFDNVLTAMSEDGTAALIAKKDMSITVVPAPGALFLLGVAGVAARPRRRRI